MGALRDDWRRTAHQSFEGGAKGRKLAVLWSPWRSRRRDQQDHRDAAALSPLATATFTPCLCRKARASEAPAPKTMPIRSVARRCVFPHRRYDAESAER